MKHKTWFRLVLKAIGVLLVGLSFPAFSQFLGYIFYMSDSTSGFPSDSAYWVVQLLYSGGVLLQLGFGLYLFFGGAWIVNKAIPSNRAYCPECGYDLRNSPVGRCAECGVAVPAPSNQSTER